MVRLLKPLEYFQLFYSDNVFAKIADFTNGNVRYKLNRARRVDFRAAHSAMYFCRPAAACGEASRCGEGGAIARGAGVIPTDCTKRE